MKDHLITIFLLLLAAVAFVIRFILGEDLQIYCDAIAFAFPTIAAIVEIVVSERSGKKMLAEIDKRPIWRTLSQEEYDKLKEEGKLDENTYYATTE